MKTYKLLPEGFKEAIKKTLPIRILLLLIALACGIYLSSINTDSNDNSLFFIIPLLFFIVSISVYYAIKKEKRGWVSSELLVSSDSITRKQINLPDIEICKEDVLSVEELSGRGLVVKTDNKNKQIIIPNTLIGYDEVKQQISGWAQIKEMKPQAGIRAFILSILPIGLMLIIYSTENKLLVIPAGVLFIIILFGCVISIQKNKNIEHKYKKIIYFLLLIILVVILRIINLIKMIKY